MTATADREEGLRPRSFLLPLLASLSLIWFFLLADLVPLSPYDEGLVVYGAQRVREGDVPYRDFWTLYAPGQLYVLAGLFEVFGASLLVERIYTNVVHVLIVVCAFRLAVRLTSPRWRWRRGP